MLKCLYLKCCLFMFSSILSGKVKSFPCSEQQPGELSNGNLQISSYSDDIKECLCEFNKTKPCVPLCCPPGEVKRKHFASKCEPYEHEIFLNTSNGIGYVESRIEEKFKVIDGRSCLGSFYVIDGVDSWMLLENGSISCNDEIYNIGSFCFDQMLTVDNKIETAVSICLKDQVERSLFGIDDSLMIASIICLIMTISIYAWIPKLQNLRGKCLICLMSALLTFFITMCFANKWTNYMNRPTFCDEKGFIIYGSILVFFFFMNIINVDNFLTVWFHDLRFRLKEKLFGWYMVYGFGVPLLIVAYVAFLDYSNVLESNYTPRVGYTSCFLINERPSISIYFYSIVISLLVVNTILFLLTAYKTLMLQNKKSEMKIESFLHVLGIFVVIECPWIFEVFLWLMKIPSGILGNIIFVTGVNGFCQGVLIFICLICRPKAFKLIKSRLSHV